MKIRKPPAIALIGCGKMGREITKLAEESGLRIAAFVDPGKDGCAAEINPVVLSDAEVCLEFTSPDQAVSNIKACAEAGKDIVVGTTGWYERLEEVADKIHSAGVGLVYARNFSIGVHLFNRIISAAAGLFDPYTQYDCGIEETHHAAKKDAPSGTALMIASTIIRKSSRKDAIKSEPPPDGLKPNELLIASSRVGTAPGTHTVVFDGVSDAIELTHRARSRAGFAEGALLAASWIHGRKGIYTFEDVLDGI